MKIGIFGFDLTSPNKGCLALTYTFLSMIERLYEGEKIEVINFTYNEGLGVVPNRFPNMEFKNYQIHLKSIKKLIELKKNIKECDLFFDGTFGDGFSDIYGKKWNVITDFIKQLVISSKTPLILLPQTYGPFESKILEKWAMHIIKNATLVYTRDELSAQYVKKCCNYDIKIASDMAFKLPYDKKVYNIPNDKINIGINISSLLWDSEWSKENHFGLTVEYKKFHEEIINYLLNNSDKYRIHIIPHVIDLENPNHRENDYRICQELKNKYEDKIEIAPPFETPIDAKNYISNMDVFMGARMHSTIAAISSGVATIPFSYSRKFEGLFGTLDYEYVISARKIDTDEAILKTKEWINEYEKIRDKGNESVKKAINRLSPLEEDLKKILKTIN